jgi:hypothetical protein
MMRLKLGKVPNRALSLGQFFEISERELAAAVVPPNPMGILVPYLQTISDNSDRFLKITGEPETLVFRMPERFRLVDASCPST